MKPFFRFEAISSGATLAIFDEIGASGTEAADFRNQLGAVSGSAISLEINSPGGDVFAGIAIYNMLKLSGKTINVRVMGVAASAASLVAMAGDTIEMPSGTFMMVHNPITAVYGNAERLRETANVLDKIGAELTAIYMRRTGMSEAAMTALLADETWLTADEALAKGFATKVTPGIEAKASFDMTAAKLPARIIRALQGKAPGYAAEVEALCQIAGQPHLAARFISASLPLPRVRAALLPHVASEPVSTTDMWNRHRNQGKAK